MRMRYELDKQAVIEELRKVPNIKAVRFELPEEYFKGSDYDGYGFIEVLIDNKDGKSLAKLGNKYTKEIIYEKLKVNKEIIIRISFNSVESSFKAGGGESDFVYSY